jgi:uncharacterized protein YcbX
VVIDGVQPHDEDRIELLRIEAEPGPIHLQPVKPCARCPIPNIDPPRRTAIRPWVTPCAATARTGAWTVQ